MIKVPKAPLLLVAGLTLTCALAAFASSTPSHPLIRGGVVWQEVKSETGECPTPQSYCTAKIVDSTPTGGVVNATTGEVIYGILFQYVETQIQWVECHADPPSSYSNTFGVYEAFVVKGPPGLAQVEGEEDTFMAHGFPDEVFELATGNGKYVRITSANLRDVAIAYYSLPGRPNKEGNNFVQDPNGSGDLNVPAPGGGVGKFDTGTAPNGTNKPVGGNGLNWDNDFGGPSDPVSRFALQLSICCDTTGDLVQFNHLP